jgi:phosphoserine phosphatase RsbU/P
MPPTLTARQVMQSDPVTVPPDAPVREVMRRMNDARIGAVPVVNASGRLVGIFSERDFLRRVDTALPGWREFPVSDWMTPRPHTIPPTVGWDDAVTLMHRLKVRHLPVVEDDRVVGIVSTRQLMNRRADYLDAVVAERTTELTRANDALLARDLEATANLRAAGRLQTKLFLPQEPPPWDELSFAVHFAPLDHLGGDYYDYATPDPDHLGLLIADASGHSLPATMVAVMTRIAFAEVASRSVHPGEVLTAMNRRLIGVIEERFVTAFYAVLNRRTRVLRYASAGHPYPYRYRPADGSIRPLVAQGFLLGIMPDEHYTEREVRLEPGDRLCFYTDGLVEARNEIGEQYGTDRLTDCLRSRGAAEPGAILDCVLAEQREFIGREPLSDDVTLVVAAIG